MKLTAIAIRSLSLPAGKTEAIVFDDDVPGFGLRIREGGSRAFVFQYKLGDKQRRMALGRVTALDIGKARETAKDLYARVRLGQDPAGDKAEAKVRATETFAAAAAQFLARQRGRLRPKSYENVERHLLTHAKVLHELQFAKVERRDIATCLAGVTTNNGAVTANRVRSTLSSLFAWAMGEGLVDRNPVTGTNQNAEMSRDRVLSPAELRIIWNALGDDHYGAIMRLLALSGQRASEIAGLRWSEVRETEIVLPPERTKNKRQHVIPLSEPARAIIAAQPRRTNADGKPREFVFGLGDGPFQGWSNSLNILNARIAETTGETLRHWTVHDLRRSFATHAAEIGIAPHIVEAVLNHVGHRAGVSGIYNRASYSREKCIALDRWAEWLTAVVEGRDTNVVTLRQA
jgi:integrase